MATPPPSAVYESWNESTEPVDVNVVALAKVAESSTPNRVSTPSLAAPTACGTVPACTPCSTFSATMLPTAIRAIAATMP